MRIAGVLNGLWRKCGPLSCVNFSRTTKSIGEELAAPRLLVATAPDCGPALLEQLANVALSQRGLTLLLGFPRHCHRSTAPHRLRLLLESLTAPPRPALIVWLRTPGFDDAACLAQRRCARLHQVAASCRRRDACARSVPYRLAVARLRSMSPRTRHTLDVSALDWGSPQEAMAGLHAVSVASRGAAH